MKIAREVLDAAARIIRPGITTDEIDQVVHDATVAAGICDHLLGLLNLSFFFLLLLLLFNA
jgi:methionine aminopeptidase